jgi:endonuclease YncB( thermonuclease family)
MARSRLAAFSAAFFAGLVLSAGFALASGSSPEPPSRKPGKPLYWSDGDSGRLPDGTRFRLHGVDAPETGGVGKRGGAHCEAERAIGYEAKAAAVALSRGAVVRVIRDYGPDQYDRRVVDLAIGETDLGAALVSGGTHLGWDYDGGAKKPDWCARLGVARASRSPASAP